MPNTREKTVLVMGASSGIGFAAVRRIERLAALADHVNVSSIEVTPTDQAAAGFIIAGPTG